VRWPAAVKFIRDPKPHELFAGEHGDVGIICQGGLYNATIRALQQLGLSDSFGATKIPVYCLNVTYPLVPEEVIEFCTGKRALLVIEEGQPAYIEDAVLALLRREEVIGAKVYGKGVLPLAGEYTNEVVLTGVARFVESSAPQGLDTAHIAKVHERLAAAKNMAAELLGAPIPPRQPSFCVGCPERPVFSAMKLIERDTGAFHISADIGCHTFSTLPPFSIGNTVLGYGLGLASNAAVDSMFGRRTVTIMGDGGFWHNGLTSGVANAVFNMNDGILLIMKNGYTSATGTQNIPSSPHQTAYKSADMGIERTLTGLGVKWMKTVHNYRVAEMAKTLKDAMTSPFAGLKVIIAEGECQLERQRRMRPQNAERLKRGQRVVRERFGVDPDTCTGDHSCIRLSGCPSLTVKPSADPLKLDPVAHVNNDCVGCGLCGEVAHAAILCPSFYRAEIVQNPGAWDRFLHAVRRTLIGWLQPATEKTAA
jgi:indolepyruvate ferredoxin oxidoreductase alpha subunit